MGPKEVVYRRIRPKNNEFKESAAVGNRIQPSNLPTKDWAVTEDSYCPSVFIASRLGADHKERLAKLAKSDPKWADCLIAVTTVEELKAVGIEVRESPEDCEFADLKEAHASLIGITSTEQRSRILKAFDVGLIQPSAGDPPPTDVPPG